VKKAELLGKIFDYLLANDIRKPVAIPKQTFTITDDTGNSRVFSVKRKDREAHYTLDDIRKVLDAFIKVAVDAVARGDSIFLPQIGTVSAQFRKERKVRIHGTMKFQTIPAHYVPKAKFAKAMRDAARVYEAYLIDNGFEIDPEKAAAALIEKKKPGRPSKKGTRPIAEMIEESKEMEVNPELLAKPEDFFNEEPEDEFDEDEDFGFDDESKEDQDDMEIEVGGVTEVTADES
jgi:nucleoid DNA-binding protein